VLEVKVGRLMMVETGAAKFRKTSITSADFDGAIKDVEQAALIFKVIVLVYGNPVPI